MRNKTFRARKGDKFKERKKKLCFRIGRFATDLLLNLSIMGHQSLDESQISCFVALDNAGAFDRVCSSALLTKLSLLGISGSILQPLGTIFKNGLLRIVFNGLASKKRLS